jgi:hypothetical protein
MDFSKKYPTSCLNILYWNLINIGPFITKNHKMRRTIILNVLTLVLILFNYVQKVLLPVYFNFPIHRKICSSNPSLYHVNSSRPTKSNLYFANSVNSV